MPLFVQPAWWVITAPLMLCTADTISFSRLANNTELMLCTPTEVYLTPSPLKRTDWRRVLVITDLLDDLGRMEMTWLLQAHKASIPIVVNV